MQLGSRRFWRAYQQPPSVWHSYPILWLHLQLKVAKLVIASAERCLSCSEPAGDLEAKTTNPANAATTLAFVAIRNRIDSHKSTEFPQFWHAPALVVREGMSSCWGVARTLVGPTRPRYAWMSIFNKILTKFIYRCSYVSFWPAYRVT